jgi:hypothetical protein
LEAAHVVEANNLVFLLLYVAAFVLLFVADVSLLPSDGDVDVDADDENRR